ncbi:MAG TPA: VWA domain-containing protein [Spirochaetia bacterium]|nr:VWA domain-containing protein [Spirochaetia bacterium]
MQAHFSFVDGLYLLWLVPLVVFGLFAAERARRRDLLRFSSGALSEAGGKGRVRRNALLLAGMILLILAGIGIGINPHSQSVKQRGREVAFLVDVSRSMLATDLAPNRLGRAKFGILDALPEFRGDRVALVAFAGSSSVICPLTYDYPFFGESVQRLSPQSVSVGGSMIGDAIRYTLKRVFAKSRNIHKDIVLMSDGGDEGSYPIRAAAEAGNDGVRILSIGFGNQTTGSRVPIGPGPHQFVTYDHREVWSKLDPSRLRSIAEATPGGEFLDVGTGTFDLGPIYRAFEKNAPKSYLGVGKVTRYQQLYQVFLGAALLVLSLELLIAWRDERRVKR